MVKEFGMDMYTPLYFKGIMNKGILYGTWSSGQCSVAAWKGGAFGEEYVHVFGWLSPFAVHLKLLQLCQLATPQ